MTSGRAGLPRADIHDLIVVPAEFGFRHHHEYKKLLWSAVAVWNDGIHHREGGKRERRNICSEGIRSAI
ncbi:hypothetical protein OJAV_G00087460 [Oryzias javanicus]|uniref:Uncharacterized protein n=1 Tax=Oryzias javanicus TaxID=123683 RepID=A0A3S2PJ31_ORYJA|nr:hypothetical protein OJAV_G00087460 [Oryzias javanicus]